MRTRMWRLGGFLALTFSLAALSGTALADPGNGNANGNVGTPPGQEKKADATPPPAAPAPAAPAAQPAAPPANGTATAPGQQKKAAASSTPSNGQAKQAEKAAAPGVKPSSSTSKAGHWTQCSTGGTASSPTCSGNGPKADGSKQYGNGKTAAQIAVSRGAPAGTVLTGPGNSQPHKVAVCPKKNNKSGGVDVHAVKSYSASCTSQSSTQSSAQAPALSTFGAAVSGGTSATGATAGMSPTTGTAQGGVLGAQATLVKPAAKRSSGGVLGAFTRLGRTASSGTLPFTGLPLWIAALVGLGLIAGGLAVRSGRAVDL
jgi:translation initiation factor IF-2